MATILYHSRHQDGKLFKQDPTGDELVALKAKGWVDHPAKLAIPEAEAADDAAEVVAPARASKASILAEIERLQALVADDEDEDEKPAAGGPMDIRTIPAAEAIEMIETITDTAVLAKIRGRESSNTKPSGGRKTVLAAIDARLDALAADDDAPDA